MMALLRYLAHSAEPSRADFALWASELHVQDVRLTSEPWMGWHEDIDGSALSG